MTRMMKSSVWFYPIGIVFLTGSNAVEWNIGASSSPGSFNQIKHNGETYSRETTSDSHGDLIKFGVDFAAVNSLISPLVENLFPLLTDSLEESLEVEATESTGSCCEFFDSGAEVSAWVRDFHMDPITEDSITMSVLPGRENSILLLITIDSINAEFNEVGAGFAFTIPFTGEIGCDVTIDVDIDIKSILLTLNLFSSSSDSKTFTLKSSDLSLGDFDLTVKSSPSGSVCDVVSLFISTLINLLTGSIQALISDQITNILADFAEKRMPDSTIEIPSLEPVDIVKNNTLAIDFQIPSFFVESDTIVARSTLDLEAALNTPSWRAGRKYVFSLMSDNGFPKPIISNLVNANIGSDGVNYLVDMLWYLAWSDLATDEKSANSTLCQPTVDDPCPLPPFREEFGVTDLAFWPLFLLGPRRSYILNSVIQPPFLEFKTGSLVQGTTQAILLIEGVTIFGGDTDVVLNMTANVEFLLSSLEYNETTDSLSGLQITEFFIDDFELEESLPFRGLPLALALAAVERVLNRQILDILVELLNEAISDALSLILNIPTVPDFPTTGQSLQVELIAVEVVGESGTNISQSYASLGANVSLQVLNDSTGKSPTILEQGFQTSDMTSKHPGNNDLREKLMNTVIDWSTESNGNPNAYFTWSYQNSKLDIFESHAYSFDSTAKLVEHNINN